MYFMCNTLRFQYDYIHCVTLETVIACIAIEHCALFGGYSSTKSWSNFIYLVKRQEFKKRHEIRHTRKQTMCILLPVQLQEMLFAVDFLHTASTILQNKLKSIYEYGASIVVCTFHYLTYLTFLNYIFLLSSTAVTINDQNIIYLTSIKKRISLMIHCISYKNIHIY